MTQEQKVSTLACVIYKMLIGCSEWYRHHHAAAMTKAKIQACNELTKHRVTRTGYCVCTHAMGG